MVSVVGKEYRYSYAEKEAGAAGVDMADEKAAQVRINSGTNSDVSSDMNSDMNSEVVYLQCSLVYCIDVEFYCTYHRRSSKTNSCTNSCTHSLTHSPTHSLTHSLTTVNQVDHYTVLGVTTDATEAQLKRAYRMMSLKYHPDKKGTR